jgi:hypothetical protein
MAISDKTRKILWGKSASKCAICKKSLVVDKNALDTDSIIGDECHIVAQNVGGPRYDEEFPEDQIDEYYNIILLCKSDHKMVDDQYQTYSTDLLRLIKQNHENWVLERLKPNDKKEKKDDPSYLNHITSGKDLFNIIDSADAFGFDFDETNDKEKTEVLKGFIQTLQDYGDISPDFTEISQKFEAMEYFSDALKEIEEIGYMVFGGREIKRMVNDKGEKFKWLVATVKILNANNPIIVKVDIANS